MINSESIKTYQGASIFTDENNLIVSPHKLLRPYIANYTFCNPQNMPEQQAILPSVSNTLVYSITNCGIINGLRGVNTKPTVIGNYAKQFTFIFLVEFHPAGLYPFIKIEQNLLRDNSFSFEELSKNINNQIINAYFISDTVSTLKQKLDHIFLSNLDSDNINLTVRHTIQRIITDKGIARIKELAGEVYYSEKQLNRLFQKHIGTNVKTFSNIVRMKHAAHLLKHPINLSELAEITGHYDSAHFAHDFKNVYGLTPKEYICNMSLFYNDPFKLGGYNKNA